MTRNPSLAVLLGIALAGTAWPLANTARADDDEPGEQNHRHTVVKWAELPQPVRAALKHEANGGRIVELRTETGADGSLIYEAEIIHGDTGRMIELSPNGKVLHRGAAHSERLEHQRR